MATCQCGCGQEVRISERNSKRDGMVKGEPMRYILGHHRRKSFIEYKEEDRGYKTPCWIWQKAISDGYGRMLDGSEMRCAHIVYYERKYGPVPHGKELDHQCRQRPCVNPDHVEPVTDEINTQRGRVAKLTPLQVAEIRTWYVHGSPTPTSKELSEKYGVGESNIRMILRGETWKNIRPEMTCEVM